MSHETTLSHLSDKSRRAEPSAIARSVWAKAGRHAQEWLPLVQHMLDSEAMAGRLFDHWLAPGTRARWAESFPGGEADARAVFTFLATVHDVGKAAPVFVAQVETLAQRARDAGLQCQYMDELRDDRAHLPHGTVGFLSVRSWLQSHGSSKVLAEQLAGVVGAHHGRPVGNPEKRHAKGRDWAMGGEQWASVRRELLDWIDGRQGFSVRIAPWGDLRIPVPVQVGMCGLLIMADWLASNQDYFALRPTDDELSPALMLPDALEDRWDWGWGEVAMPAAWAPASPSEDTATLYRTRFGWNDTVPRPVQTAAVDLVRERDVSMLIIEAGMGSGKTEAAFVAGEVLAAKWGAQGIFVALPTQATTDAMFTRMIPWLARLPEAPEDVPAWAMTLAHGKAALNRLYGAHAQALDDFIRRGDIGRVHPDEAHAGVSGIHEDDHIAGRSAAPELTNAVAHQWFRGRKRRLLANFGIGTIDQILMAGLQQRHLMLRHLALAGKVVVVDEVHASDDFMNVYLDAVLHWLGHYGVPVILLSATLTAERKRAMLAAYAPGAALPDAVPGYPLLTWVDGGRQHAEARAVPDHAEPRRVQWNWVSDDDDELVAVVHRALRDGGCALVVRNTVKDAQRLARRFEDTGQVPEVILAHARFLAADRAANDARLLQFFGPESGRGSRPHKAVVVATQVVEQSLDVDFDVLVTDLAPMDLLFQRIGRLHRHTWRTRPSALTEARVHVIAEPHDGVRGGNRGSSFVYGENALLRTALVLDERGPSLTLPTDIAPLVERALSTEELVVPAGAERVFASAQKKAEQQAQRRRDTAKGARLDDWDPEGDTSKSLGRWIQLGTDPSEARIGAMVRDAKPSLEVIIVPILPDGSSALVPPWMDDPAVLDTSALPDDDTAHRLATWTVRMPPSLTISPERLDATLRELQDNHARGWPWHRHRLIKGEPILPMRQTNEGSTTLEATLFAGTEAEIRLRYSPEQGLEEVHDDIQPDR